MGGIYGSDWPGTTVNNVLRALERKVSSPLLKAVEKAAGGKGLDEAQLDKALAPFESRLSEDVKRLRDTFGLYRNMMLGPDVNWRRLATAQQRQILATLIKAGRRDLARRLVCGGRALPSSLRKKVNVSFGKVGLDGNGRFGRIGEGLGKIAEVLNRHGLQQGDVFNAHMFSGPSGHRTFDIEFTTDDPFAPDPITNSMLVVQWYQHGPGSVEVLAYLS